MHKEISHQTHPSKKMEITFVGGAMVTLGGVHSGSNESWGNSPQLCKQFFCVNVNTSRFISGFSPFLGHLEQEF